MLRAQSPFGVILEESFEDGKVPDGWVTEHVKGSQDWMVEKGGSRPDGAYDGEWRLVFRNTTGVTHGDITRLILPVTDVTALFQPQLCIAFAQDKWTNDFDTLRIVYRKNETAAWETLRTYGHYVSYWTTDTIDISAFAPTYQLAFEAVDNLGQGIVIDKVEIRSAPVCTEPYDLKVDTVKNNRAVLKWNAGIDATSYRICVSSVTVSQDDLLANGYKADVKDTVIAGGDSNKKEFAIEGLSQGTAYYVYMQSQCMIGETMEYSGWSEELEFKTTNVAEMPFHETFNLPYTGQASQLTAWTFGTSMDGTMIPVVNTNQSSDYDLGNHSRDTTTSLVFASMPNSYTTSPVTANEYAYAATPELPVEDVSKLEVRFWTNENVVNKSEINRIIVGVMTNPMDFRTFVGVDTVSLSRLYVPEEFVVTLESYVGEGKYVAFASNFGSTNIFYVDDVTIQEMPTPRREDNFIVSLPSADRMVISWNRHGASGGEVIISETMIEDFTAAEDTVKTFTGDAFSAIVKPATSYFVYVRNVNGSTKGEWSKYRLVHTPEKYTEDDLSKQMDFTAGGKYKLFFDQWAAEIVPDAISLMTNILQSTRISLSTTFSINCERPSEYAYIVFPELPGDVKQLRASFWAKGYNRKNGTFSVGLMSDANDTTTFVPLSDWTVGGQSAERIIVPFDTYSSQDGKFFAIRLRNSGVILEKIEFEPIPNCKEASNVEVLPGATRTEFSWDANGAKEWRLRVSKEEVPYDSLSNERTGYQYVYDKLSDSTHVMVDGLEGNGITYYYYLQTVCDGQTSDWSSAKPFATECYEEQPLPYVQNFDRADYETGSQEIFTVPCLYTTTVKNGSYYPQLSSGTRHNGRASLYFSPAKGAVAPQYIILPQMAKPLQELQLEMHFRSTKTGVPMAIGAVDNPNSISSFDSITDVYVTKTNTFQEYRIRLDGYSGDKRHIAIRTTPAGGGTQFYIDSIVVREIDGCTWVTYPTVSAVTATTAVAEWRTGTEENWDIVVATRTMTVEELNTAMATQEGSNPEGVYLHKTIGKDEYPYTITGLRSETTYYYYVSANCGDGSGRHWTEACQFKTVCEAVTPEEFATEDFEGTIGCWTVGNTTNNNVFAYKPSIAAGNNASGKNSLKLSSTTAYNGAYAITPMLDVEDIRTLQVHFYGKVAAEDMTDTKQKQLLVGVATDPADPGTFEYVDTVDGYADGKYYTVTLDKYDGRDYMGNAGKYVIFMSYFGKDNTFYMDDVHINEIPTCRLPDEITISDPTENSVQISWEETYKPYTIKVATRMLSDEELDSEEELAGVITEEKDKPSFDFSGLKPVTTYYVYIRTGCENGDKSGWSQPYLFKTACPAAYDLTYQQNFDNAVNVPDCWTAFHAGVERTYPALNTMYVHGEGGKSWQLYANSTDSSYVVAPALNIDNISDCQVIFYAYGNVSYPRGLLIGAVSDISSNEAIMETFVPIETVVLKASDEWQKINVSLGGYDGEGKYIAIVTSYSAAGNNAGTVNIDDLSIIERPECADPDFFSFVSASDTSVVLEFRDYAGTDTWEIKYGNVGFASSADAGTTVPIDHTRDTVTGLSAATEYDFYVRAVCGGNQYSAWVGPVSAKTTPTPVTAPYEDTFEDADKAKVWTFIDDAVNGNAWCIGDALYHGESGTSMYVSNDDGESAKYNKYNLQGESYAYAYFPVKIEEGEYTFSYDWRGVGEGNNDYMRIGLLPADITLGGADGTLYRGNEELGSIDVTRLTDATEYVSLEGANSNRNGTRRYLNGATDWTHNEVIVTISEEMSGTYNLVIFWNNISALNDGPEPSMVVDNLSIDYTSCVSPSGLKVKSVTDNAVSISWQAGTTAVAYDVFVTDNSALATPDDAEDEDEVFSDSKTDKTTSNITGLEPWTIYRAYVRAYCSEDGEPGNWSAPLEFRTMCTASEPGILYDFEKREGEIYDYNGNSMSETFMPNCFTRLHPTIDLSDYRGYAAGTVYRYSRNRHSHGDGEFSLYFTSANESDKGGAVVMPAIDADLTSKQLSFWIRPFTVSEDGSSIISVYTLNQARAITVGTLEDPNDLSTFKTIETVTYPYTASDLSSTTNVKEYADELWVKFTVSLEDAEGKYLSFRNDGFEGYANTIYIDDVVVEELQPTYRPYDVKTTVVSGTEAKITWTTDGGTSWIVQLSGKADMSDTVVIDTVTVKEYQFSSLTAGADYYATVRTTNNETGLVSEPSAAVSFLTPYLPCFEESFVESMNAPKYWTRAIGKAADVFAGNSFTVLLETDNSRGWSYNIGSKNMDGGHQAALEMCSGRMNINPAWLISPTIELADSAFYTLMFDLAISDSESGEPVSKDNKDMFDATFMVIVSEDDGLTWKETNATIWDCTGIGDYMFYDIPYESTRYFVDLNAYKSKRIKIAFYVESTYNLEQVFIDLHLDNVRVNAAVEANYSVGLCETEDFRGYGLDLVDSELSLGADNVFEDYRLAASADVPDTVQTVNITVEPLGEYPVYGTICRGGRYTEDGFDAAEAGEYKKKIRREGMCDSVVVLTLEVIDPAESLTIDSICEGGEYAWGDTVYRRPGTYHDTLQMSGLECDSIATLVLKVIPVEVHHTQMTVCYGEHYTWGDTTLTTTGVYRRRFETTGCDSIVELDFTVRPDLRKTYREVICSGESFTGYGFKDGFTPGEHPLPITTDDGCDSTVTLVLTVIESDTTYVNDTVTTDELPYEYLDLYYGEDTRPGTYRDTITAEAGAEGECSTVIVHTLTVEATTWWGGAETDVRGLVIAPNPVEVGGTVTLGIELTAAERDGATVCVYSAAGAMVKSVDVPEEGDITMTCWFSPGVYMVRLTTGTGEQYNGKIIVR